MKLQLALDAPLQSSLTTLGAVRRYIDIAEIGTPLLYREGIGAARLLRQAFADLPLLADLKIIDAGEAEAEIAFQAGCEYITVLGSASRQTILGALRAARAYGGTVMMDMIQVPNPLPRAMELIEMGCRLLCVHTPHDRLESGEAPLQDLRRLRRALPEAPLAVAGGINLDTLPTILGLEPAIVVVGSAITAASDPEAAAKAIRAKMEGR
jgi:3-hexulose-6-phosphate synthase